MVAISGKLALTGEARAWLPERLSGSVNNIMPPAGSFMFTAVWEGDRRRLADSDAAARPGLLFDNTQDYVFWAYAADRSAYPAEPSGDGARLRDMVASMISGWHPALRRLVGESDPTTIAPVIIKSMAPVPPWPASRVTLLGDAIHNMNPDGRRRRQHRPAPQPPGFPGQCGTDQARVRVTPHQPAKPPGVSVPGCAVTVGNGLFCGILRRG